MKYVRFSFGMLIAAGASLTSTTSSRAEAPHRGAMVLAISWQAAFCERSPRRRECLTQKIGRYDATNFSLHGLWPQPASNSYCGVSQKARNFDKRRRWKKLKGLGLSDEVKRGLFKSMPGTRSYLHRHEWVKHGTCYSDTPETYYRHSLKLVDQINRSSVRALFARSIGKTLTSQQIRREFDRAFGKGTGARVRISCRNDGYRTLISELTVGLRGEIGGTDSIGDLMLASNRTKPGCPSGTVDPVGLQ